MEGLDGEHRQGQHLSLPQQDTVGLGQTLTPCPESLRTELGRRLWARWVLGSPCVCGTVGPVLIRKGG